MGEVTYDPPENHPMTDRPLPTELAIQIQKPCPKSWGELIGDEKKRFCSECSLHVHNAAQLSRSEARDIVSSGSSRVCMRIEYDPCGAPIFRDSKFAGGATARSSQSRIAHLARWALSAAAGVLAACSGSPSNSTSNDPAATPNVGESPSKMGEASSTELLGGVEAPPRERPEKMGDVLVIPEPAPPPPPDASTSKEEQLPH